MHIHLFTIRKSPGVILIYKHDIYSRCILPSAIILLQQHLEKITSNSRFACVLGIMFKCNNNLILAKYLVFIKSTISHHRNFWISSLIYNYVIIKSVPASLLMWKTKNLTVLQMIAFLSTRINMYFLHTLQYGIMLSRSCSEYRIQAYYVSTAATLINTSHHNW